MLLKGFERVPAKRVGQVRRALRVIPVLQIVEQALHGDGDRGPGVLVLSRRDAVYGFAKGRDVVQGLQQRVEVAGCALVDDTHAAGGLTRVVARVVGTLEDADPHQDMQRALGV